MYTSTSTRVGWTGDKYCTYTGWLRSLKWLLVTPWYSIVTEGWNRFDHMNANSEGVGWMHAQVGGQAIWRYCMSRKCMGA